LILVQERTSAELKRFLRGIFLVKNALFLPFLSLFKPKRTFVSIKKSYDNYNVLSLVPVDSRQLSFLFFSSFWTSSIHLQNPWQEGYSGWQKLMSYVLSGI